MLGYKITVAFSLFAFFITSCDAPTKINRNNPSDPDNPTFDLQSSQNFSAEILPNKLINLVWEDTSEFSTSYVIEKSVTDPVSFSMLETVDGSKRSFIDNSQDIFSDTKYLIYNVRETENGIIKHSDSIIVSIEFGGIESQTSTFNDDTTAIIMNWEFQKEWPFIPVVYTYDYESENEIILDTLPAGVTSYTSPTFEKDFSERFYSIRFFVDENEVMANNYVAETFGLYSGGMEFLPEIAEIEIINEGKVVINWKDNSDFEDGFRVLRSQGVNRVSATEPVVIAEVGSNISTFTDTLNPFKGYIENEFGGETLTKTYYGIQAFKNETQTGTCCTEISLDILIEDFKLDALGDNFATFSWEVDQPNKVEKFILQHSTTGIFYRTYEILTADKLQYTANNLDRNTPHYFRISTTTSKASEEIGIRYTNYLVEEHLYDFPITQNIRFSDSGKYLIASKGLFSDDINHRGIAVFNTESMSTSYENLSIPKSVFGVDIHEESNLLAYTSISDNSRSLTVYDFIADSVFFETDDYQVFDVEFSPEGDFLYSNGINSEITKFDLTNKSVAFSKGLESPTSTVRSISVSPTGDSIAYNSDGLFKLYSSSGNRIDFSHVLDYGSTSQKVDFSQSGKYISNVSDFNNAEIHFTKPGSRYFRTNAQHISISFNDKYFITSFNSSLILYDLTSQKVVLSFPVASGVLDLKFSPTEELIAIGTYDGVFTYRISNDKKWSRIFD